MKVILFIFVLVALPLPSFEAVAREVVRHEPLRLDRT